MKKIQHNRMRKNDVRKNKSRQNHARILCVGFLIVICFTSLLFSHSSQAAETSPPRGDTSTENDTPTERAASVKSDTPAEEKQEEEVLQSLAGKTAGVMTGTPQDEIVKANIQGASIQYFNTASDLILALESHKIDFFVLSSVNYYSMAEENDNLGYLDVTLQEYDIGTIFSQTETGKALCDQYNAYIAKIKKDGTLEKLQEYWLYPNDWEDIDIPAVGKNGVLTMATANTLKPFSFMLHEKNAGFDIAIAAGFCREYGYGLQIENVDFAGVLSGITSGKYDLAAGQIAWTEERAKSVRYSDSYYVQKIVPILLADETDSSYLVTAENNTNGTGNSVSFTQHTLKNSIRRTLIEDHRWKSVLDGLLVTLCITFFGFILANVLGALFCAMELSKFRILKGIANLYSGLMQGLPIVVILMILYYIIFGNSQISNIFVAIIGFGLVFGAYMAQLFTGGINSVEVGQREAALAIGLTKRQTFFGIILPQAVRTMLPGYFSNLISLLKGTAIVGYIAVNDLTKAGDIIRSSTYEAIVPLLVVAIGYAVIASILIVVMKLIQKKLFRKARKEEEA